MEATFNFMICSFLSIFIFDFWFAFSKGSQGISVISLFNWWISTELKTDKRDAFNDLLTAIEVVSMLV